MPFCRGCGAILQFPITKFCQQCGKPTARAPAPAAAVKKPPVDVEKKPTCPKCSSELANGLKFCEDCGYRLPAVAIGRSFPAAGAQQSRTAAPAEAKRPSPIDARVAALKHPAPVRGSSVKDKLRLFGEPVQIPKAVPPARLSRPRERSHARKRSKSSANWSIMNRTQRKHEHKQEAVRKATASRDDATIRPQPGHVAVFGRMDKTRCGVCNTALGAESVDVGVASYHLHCFKCAGCGCALRKACLNIADKPYCNRCGRTAFVKFYAQRRKRR